MIRRNLFVMFILMGNLQGLYVLYWMLSVNDDLPSESVRTKSRGMHMLLLFVTLGIYGLIWQWRVCRYLREKRCRDLRVLTLILSFCCGIGILLNPLLIQKEINSLIPDFRIKPLF